MRIGMLLDAVFPPDPRVENEAVSLIRAGHEVFLFCLNYDGQKAKEDWNGIEVRRYRATWFDYKMSALAYTFPFYTHSMAKKNPAVSQEELHRSHSHPRHANRGGCF